MLAYVTRAIEEQGADINDINLGCPAKRVLKKTAGQYLCETMAYVRIFFAKLSLLWISQ